MGLSGRITHSAVSQVSLKVTVHRTLQKQLLHPFHVHQAQTLTEKNSLLKYSSQKPISFYMKKEKTEWAKFYFYESNRESKINISGVLNRKAAIYYNT